MKIKNLIAIGLTGVALLSGCNSVENSSTEPAPSKEVIEEKVVEKEVENKEAKPKEEKVEKVEKVEKKEVKEEVTKEEKPSLTEKDVVSGEYYEIPLSDSVQEYIINFSEKKDIAHTLVLGVIAKETGVTFDPNAVGSTGDYGLMQWHKPSGTFDWLREQTASELGISVSQVKWNNPKHNVTGGIWYLDWLRDYWIDKGYTSQENLVALVLLSYNMGIGNAGDYIKTNSPYDWDYVGSVLDYKAQLEQYNTIK